MWLPIEYRDFHDVPRMLIAEHNGQVFLFDCPFDREADEYGTDFRVYRLNARPTGTSWASLAEHGDYVGSIAVDSVRFDSTRRGAIDVSGLDLLS